jgi:hypothetical protein
VQVVVGRVVVVLVVVVVGRTVVVVVVVVGRTVVVVVVVVGRTVVVVVVVVVRVVVVVVVVVRVVVGTGTASPCKPISAEKAKANFTNLALCSKLTVPILSLGVWMSGVMAFTNDSTGEQAA